MSRKYPINTHSKAHDINYYALASVSAKHLELLEALILNYGHHKVDEEAYTKIMSYLEALHSKWENSYVNIKNQI